MNTGFGLVAQINTQSHTFGETHCGHKVKLNTALSHIEPNSILLHYIYAAFLHLCGMKNTCMSIIFPWWCVAHISITLCDVDFSRGELNFFTFRGVANKFKKSHYVIAGCSYTSHMCAWACVCVSVDFFHRKKKRNEMKERNIFYYFHAVALSSQQS